PDLPPCPTRRSSDLAAMQQAYDLRRDIWTISDALRGGRGADLRLVNQLLSAAPRQPDLVRQDRAYRHAFAGTDVREPLWPVLWSDRKSTRLNSSHVS